MAKGITIRQHQVFVAICDYIKENGFPPTVRELSALVGMRYNRSVTVHMDALAKKGYIHRERNGVRAIRILKNLDGTVKS